MNKIKTQKLIDQGLSLAIFLMAAFPIMPNSLKNIGFITLLLFSLTKYFFLKKKKPKIKRFLINTSLYLMYLLSLFYTDSFDVAGQKLDTAITLVVFPFIFFLLRPIDNKNSLIKKFTSTYYIFSIVYSSIVVAALFYNYGFQLYSDSWFIRNTVIEIPLIPQHPIYASLIIGLGLLFSFPYFAKRNNCLIKVQVGILNLFLIIVIVSLASKGVIIALVLASISYMFLNLERKKTKVISIITIVLFFVISIFYFPPFIQRFKELKEVGNLEIKLDKYSSTSIRKGIYYCSTIKISENWFFGYGIGDVQPVLNDCYKTIDDDIFNKFDYNSHNQYLGVSLSTGILGLSALLLILISNFYLAITNKDWVFLSILVLFSISFATENMLERQSGVVLFSFLLSFFGQNGKNTLPN